MSYVDVFLDVLWISIIYTSSYKTLDYILANHINIFKEIFNIEIRYYAYNSVESSTYSEHEILYTIASTILLLSMSISPVIHSILYLAFYNIIDIIQFNKILLTITLIKLLWFLNLQNTILYLNKMSWYDYITVAQFLFIIFNYNNTSTIIPIVFQLIEECSNLENVLISLLRHYKTLFNSDSMLDSKISALLIRIKLHKKKLIKGTIIILSFIIFLSIFMSNLTTYGEIIFYYYAILKIILWNGQIDRWW